MASAMSSLQLQQRPAFSSRATAPRRAAAARLAVRAEGGAAQVKPPQGVTLPPKSPSMSASMTGFVENAERLNSRAAMIGFFALLALELVAGQGILDLIGITTGKGLGFEF